MAAMNKGSVRLPPVPRSAGGDVDPELTIEVKQLVGSPAHSRAGAGLTSYEQFQAIFGYAPSELLPSEDAGSLRATSNDIDSPTHKHGVPKRARSSSPLARSAHASSGAHHALAYSVRRKDEQQLTPAQQRTIQFRSAITKSTLYSAPDFSKDSIMESAAAFALPPAPPPPSLTPALLDGLRPTIPTTSDSNLLGTIVLPRGDVRAPFSTSTRLLHQGNWVLPEPGTTGGLMVPPLEVSMADAYTYSVPPEVATGEDAVRLFSSSAAKPGLIIYCNLNPATLERTGEYNPYDLLVVERARVDPRHHYIMTQNGVTHMLGGHAQELLPYHAWRRERDLFTILRKLVFFKKNELCQTFWQWRDAVRILKFRARQRYLAAQLLVLSPLFHKPLLNVRRMTLAAASDTHGTWRKTHDGGWVEVEPELLAPPATTAKTQPQPAQAAAAPATPPAPPGGARAAAVGTPPSGTGAAGAAGSSASGTDARHTSLTGDPSTSSFITAPSGSGSSTTAAAASAAAAAAAAAAGAGAGSCLPPERLPESGLPFQLGYVGTSQDQYALADFKRMREEQRGTVNGALQEMLAYVRAQVQVVGQAVSEQLAAAQAAVAKPTRQQARQQRFEPPSAQPWRHKSLALSKQDEAQRQANLAAAQHAARQLLRFITLADALVLGQLTELARLAVLLTVRQLLEMPRKNGLFIVSGAVDDSGAGRGGGGLPAWGRSPTLGALSNIGTMRRMSMSQAALDSPHSSGSAAASSPPVFVFSPGSEELSLAVSHLPREILHVVTLSASALAQYPEVRQLMNEVGAAAGIAPALLPAPPPAGAAYGGSALGPPGRSYDSFIGGTTRLMATYHGEVLRQAVDVPEIMTRLQDSIASDYQAAMAHAAMQAFIGHEQQWAMVSRFTPELYSASGLSPEQLHADLSSVGAWLKEMSAARTTSVAGLVHLDMGALQRVALPAITRAYSGIMSTLGALLVGQAQASRSALAEATEQLVARPSQLADFVQFVEAVWPHLDPLSGRRQQLAADMDYMQRLHAIYTASVGSSAGARPNSPTMYAPHAAGASSASTATGGAGSDSDDESSRPPDAARVAAVWQALQATRARYEEEARAAAEYFQNAAALMVAHLKTALIESGNEVQRITVQLRTGPSTDPQAQYAAVRAELDGMAAVIRSRQAAYEQHASWARLLAHPSVAGLVTSLEGALAVVSSVLAGRQALWEVVRGWQAFLERLYEVPCNDGGAEALMAELKAHVGRIREHAGRITSLHTDEDVSSLRTVTPQEQRLGAHLSLLVKSWTDVLPIALRLVQPAVKARHLCTLLAWLTAHAAAAQPGAGGGGASGTAGGGDSLLDPYVVPVMHVSEDSAEQDAQAARTSLAHLVARCSESPGTRELVERIVQVAQGEAALLAWLGSIQERLQGLPLQYSAARSWGAFTPANLPHVLAGIRALTDELGAVRNSRYFGGVLAAYERVEQLVAWVGRTLQDVSSCLDLWTFLSQLLANPAVAERAPDAVTSLELLSNTWRKLHMAAMEQPTLTAAAVALQDCRLLLTGLQALRRGMGAPELLLTPLRAAYPRLWLAGDEVLLQALAAGAEVEAVPCALWDALFPGMLHVDLAAVERQEEQEAASAQALEFVVSGVVGRHGERCALSRPLPLPAGPLRLDTWLPQLEAELHASMVAHTRECVAACGQIHPDQWVAAYPSQCVMLVDAIVWTQSVTALLSRTAQGERAVLRGLLDQAVLRLESMARQLRTSLAGLPHGALSSARAVEDAAGRQAGDAQMRTAVAVTAAVRRGVPAAEAAPWPPTAADALMPSSMAPPSSAIDASDAGGPAAVPTSPLPAGGVFSRARRMAILMEAGTQEADAASLALTRQAARGLERLIGAGICHRQVIEDLINHEVTSPDAFEWQRQVRHYWDADRGVVEVAFALNRHEYGFEYNGAEQDYVGMVLPLAVPSLLAAVSAMHASPVVSLAHADLSCRGAGAVRSICGVLGRLHVSAACDAATSPASLARYLTSALALNAWLSLEALELLSLASISALGEMLHAVYSAASTRAQHINLLGESVPSPWSRQTIRQRAAGMPPELLPPLPAVFLSLPLHVHLPLCDDAPAPFATGMRTCVDGSRPAAAGGGTLAGVAPTHGPWRSELCELSRRAGRVVTVHTADLAVALEAGLRCLGLRDAQEAARAASSFYKLAAAQLPPSPQLKLDALLVRGVLKYVQEVWLVQVQAGGGAEGASGGGAAAGGMAPAGAAAAPSAPSSAGGVGRIGRAANSAIDAVSAAMRALVLPAANAEDAGLLTRLLDQVIAFTQRTPPPPEAAAAPPAHARGPAPPPLNIREATDRVLHTARELAGVLLANPAAPRRVSTMDFVGLPAATQLGPPPPSAPVTPLVGATRGAAAAAAAPGARDYQPPALPAWAMELQPLAHARAPQLTELVASLYQMLLSSRAVLLAGPAGAGKTCVWKALVAAVAGPQVLVSEHHLVRLFPEVLLAGTGAQLLGAHEGDASPDADGDAEGDALARASGPAHWLLSQLQGSQRWVLRPRAVDAAGAAEPVDALPRWLVVDGPLGTPAADLLGSLLLSPAMVNPPGGAAVASLADGAHTVWEAADLSCASPALLTTVPVLFVGGDGGLWDDEQALLASLNAFMQETGMRSCVSAYFTRRLAGLMVGTLAAFDATLQRVRDPVRGSHSRHPGRLQGLAALFSEVACSLTRPTEPLWSGQSAELEQSLARCALFALYWALAGQVLGPGQRGAVEDAIRQQAQMAGLGDALPTTGSLAARLVTPLRGAWLPWSATLPGMAADRTGIVPSGVIPGAMFHYFQDGRMPGGLGLFVPDERTQALQYVLQVALQAGLHPLLVGPSGSGRGTLVRHLLATTSLKQMRHDVVHMPASPGMQPSTMQALLLWHLNAGAGGSLRPTLGHMLMVVVEDLHLGAQGCGQSAAAQAAGARPDVFTPGLEWLRQVMDTRALQDSMFGSSRLPLQGVLLACTASPGNLMVGSEQVSARLWRHLQHLHIDAAAQSRAEAFEVSQPRALLSVFTRPEVCLALAQHTVAQLVCCGVAQVAAMPLPGVASVLAAAYEGTMDVAAAMARGGAVPPLWQYNMASLGNAVQRLCCAVADANGQAMAGSSSTPVGGAAADGAVGGWGVQDVVYRLCFEVGRAMACHLDDEVAREALAKVLLQAMGRQLGALVSGKLDSVTLAGASADAAPSVAGTWRSEEEVAASWRAYLKRDEKDLTALRVSLAGRIAPRDISTILLALAGHTTARDSAAAAAGDLRAYACGWVVEQRALAPLEDVRQQVAALVDARRGQRERDQDGGRSGGQAKGGRRSSFLDAGLPDTPRMDTADGSAPDGGHMPQCSLGTTSLELMADALRHWGYRDLVWPAALQLLGGYLRGGHVALVGPNPGMLVQTGCLAALGARARLIRLERVPLSRPNGGMTPSDPGLPTPTRQLLQQLHVVLRSMMQLQGSAEAPPPPACELVGGFTNPGAGGAPAVSQGSGRAQGQLHVVLLTEEMLMDEALLELLQALLTWPGVLALLSWQLQEGHGLSPGKGVAPLIMDADMGAMLGMGSADMELFGNTPSSGSPSGDLRSALVASRSLVSRLFGGAAQGGSRERQRNGSSGTGGAGGSEVPRTGYGAVGMTRRASYRDGPPDNAHSGHGAHGVSASGAPAPGNPSSLGTLMPMKSEADATAFASAKVAELRAAERARGELLAGVGHRLLAGLRFVMTATPPTWARLRARFPALCRALTPLHAAVPLQEEQQASCLDAIRHMAPHVVENRVPQHATEEVVLGLKHSQQAAAEAAEQGAGADKDAADTDMGATDTDADMASPSPGAASDKLAGAMASPRAMLGGVRRMGSPTRGNVEAMRKRTLEDAAMMRRVAAAAIAIHGQAQELYQQTGLLAPAHALPLSKVSDFVEVLGLVHSSHKKVLHSRQATLYVCLAKLRHSSAQLELCGSSIGELEAVMDKKRAEIKTVAERVELLQKFTTAATSELKDQERKADAAQAIIDQVHAEVDAALGEAKRHYASAIEEVGGLQEAALAEVRSYKEPHVLIRLVVMALCVLFDWPTDWRNAQRLLGEQNPKLVERCRDFDVAAVSAVHAAKLARLVQEPEFNIVSVEQVSVAAKSLCWWVLCVSQLLRVQKECDLKLNRIKEGEERLANTNKYIRKLRGELSAAQSELHRQQQQQQDLQQQVGEASAQLRDSDLQRNNILKLSSLLEGMMASWQAKLDQVEAAIPRLVGDAALAAACMTYLGPLDRRGRAAVVAAWRGLLQQHEVPVSPDFDFSAFVGERFPQLSSHLPPEQLANMEPLWRDNWALMFMARRPPLLLDPGREAVNLIKAAFGKASRHFAVLTEDGLLDKVVNTVRSGRMLVVDTYGSPEEDALLPRLTKVYEHAMRATYPNLATEPHHLYLRLRTPNATLSPATHQHFTPVRFALRGPELRARLARTLLSTLAHEREVLSRQLSTKLWQHRAHLQQLNDGITFTISQTKGSIWVNPGLVDSMVTKAHQAAAAAAELPRLEAEAAEVTAAVERWAPLLDGAMRCHAALQDLAGSGDVHAQLPDTQFVALFRAALRRSVTEVAGVMGLVRELQGSTAPPVQSEAEVKQRTAKALVAALLSRAPSRAVSRAASMAPSRAVSVMPSPTASDDEEEDGDGRDGGSKRPSASGDSRGAISRWGSFTSSVGRPVGGSAGADVAGELAARLPLGHQDSIDSDDTGLVLRTASEHAVALMAAQRLLMPAALPAGARCRMDDLAPAVLQGLAHLVCCTLTHSGATAFRALCALREQQAAGEVTEEEAAIALFVLCCGAPSLHRGPGLPPGHHLAELGTLPMALRAAAQHQQLHLLQHPFSGRSIGSQRAAPLRPQSGLSAVSANNDDGALAAAPAAGGAPADAAAGGRRETQLSDTSLLNNAGSDVAGGLQSAQLTPRPLSSSFMDPAAQLATMQLADASISAGHQQQQPSNHPPQVLVLGGTGTGARPSPADSPADVASFGAGGPWPSAQALSDLEWLEGSCAAFKRELAGVAASVREVPMAWREALTAAMAAPHPERRPGAAAAAAAAGPTTPHAAAGRMSGSASFCLSGPPPAAVLARLPERWKLLLQTKPLAKALLASILAPEALSCTLEEMAAPVLGPQRDAMPAAERLLSVLMATGAGVPLVLSVLPGEDPVTAVQQAQSLCGQGQGQGLLPLDPHREAQWQGVEVVVKHVQPDAVSARDVRAALGRCVRSGSWLLLLNAHANPQACVALLEQLNAKEYTMRGGEFTFRLILALPHDAVCRLHPNVLAQCVQCALQPPPSLRAYVNSAMLLLAQPACRRFVSLFGPKGSDLELATQVLAAALLVGGLGRALSSASPAPVAPPLTWWDFLSVARLVRRAIMDTRAQDDQSSLDFGRLHELVAHEVLLPALPSCGRALVPYALWALQWLLAPGALSLSYPVHALVDPDAEPGNEVALTMPLNASLAAMLDYLKQLQGMEAALHPAAPWAHGQRAAAAALAVRLHLHRMAASQPSPAQLFLLPDEAPGATAAPLLLARTSLELHRRMRHTWGGSGGDRTGAYAAAAAAGAAGRGGAAAPLQPARVSVLAHAEAGSDSGSASHAGSPAEGTSRHASFMGTPSYPLPPGTPLAAGTPLPPPPLQLSEAALAALVPGTYTSALEAARSSASSNSLLGTHLAPLVSVLAGIESLSRVLMAALSSRLAEAGGRTAQQRTPLSSNLSALFTEFWFQEVAALHGVAEVALAGAEHLMAAGQSPEAALVLADSAGAQQLVRCLAAGFVPRRWRLPPELIAQHPCAALQPPASVGAALAAQHHHALHAQPLAAWEAELRGRMRLLTEVADGDLDLIPPSLDLSQLANPAAVLVCMLRAYALERNTHPANIVCRIAMQPPQTREPGGASSGGAAGPPVGLPGAASAPAPSLPSGISPVPSGSGLTAWSSGGGAAAAAGRGLLQQNSGAPSTPTRGRPLEAPRVMAVRGLVSRDLESWQTSAAQAVAAMLMSPHVDSAAAAAADAAAQTAELLAVLRRCEVLYAVPAFADPALRKVLAGSGRGPMQRPAAGARGGGPRGSGLAAAMAGGSSAPPPALPVPLARSAACALMSELAYSVAWECRPGSLAADAPPERLPLLASGRQEEDVGQDREAVLRLGLSGTQWDAAAGARLC